MVSQLRRRLLVVRNSAADCEQTTRARTSAGHGSSGETQHAPGCAVVAKKSAAAIFVHIKFDGVPRP